MKTFKGYVNYGVLAHEKQKIFSVGNPNYSAVASDEIEITVPDGYSVHENEYGGILIETPHGETYLASEILTNMREQPYLIYIHENKPIKAKCQWKLI